MMPYTIPNTANSSNTMLSSISNNKPSNEASGSPQRSLMPNQYHHHYDAIPSSFDGTPTCSSICDGSLTAAEAASAAIAASNNSTNTIPVAKQYSHPCMIYPSSTALSTTNNYHLHWNVGHIDSIQDKAGDIQPYHQQLPHIVHPYAMPGFYGLPYPHPPPPHHHPTHPNNFYHDRQMNLSDQVTYNRSYTPVFADGIPSPMLVSMIPANANGFQPTTTASSTSIHSHMSNNDGKYDSDNNKNGDDNKRKQREGKKRARKDSSNDVDHPKILMKSEVDQCGNKLLISTKLFDEKVIGSEVAWIHQSRVKKPKENGDQQQQLQADDKKNDDALSPSMKFRTACDDCTARKVKCAVKHGNSTCDQCLRRNVICVFSMQRKRGPRRGAPKVASPDKLQAY